MEQKRKVLVAGAGAAGLMAAIWAARKGAEVTILEAMERPGKKLLLTGNGRCNLTNLDENLPKAYHGTGKELAETVIRQFDARELCRFFRQLGLLTQEKNGYVYPYSAQSSAVLETLLAEVRRLKIKLKLSEKIVEILPFTHNWAVKTAGWTYYADSLIIACGSKCIPAAGSDGSGYDLARALGHTTRPVVPALVPVTCKADYLPGIAGVRCRAKVSLWKYECNHLSKEKSEPRIKQLIASDIGELQWTKYGVSGIVVFQLSRFVSAARPEEKLTFSIDLLPDFTKEQLFELLSARASSIGQEKVSVLLSGILNDKLIPVVLGCADFALSGNRSAAEAGKKQKKKIRSLLKYSCSELSEAQLTALIGVMKELELPITGTKSFDTCQVCAGGIDCSEVDPVTLESKIQPHLYFAGEILDVDGPCGGYNLQWAWSSGYLAGISASEAGSRL